MASKLAFKLNMQNVFGKTCLSYNTNKKNFKYLYLGYMIVLLEEMTLK